MLRLIFPPNIAASAPRDAIAMRLEFDARAQQPPEYLTGLAALQRLCGSEPAQYFQLNRKQLRELIQAFEELPVFFASVASAKAIAWKGGTLDGISKLLEEVPTVTTASVGAESCSARTGVAPRKRVAAGSTPLLIDGSEHYLAITLPSREHPTYDDALSLLKTQGFLLEPSNRKWWLRDRHKTLAFLAAHWSRLTTEWGAQFAPNFLRNTAHIRPAEVNVDVRAAADNPAAFDVTVGLNAAGVDEAGLRLALASNRGYVEAGGRIHLLDPAKLEQLARANGALAGTPGAGGGARTHRIAAARVPDAAAVLEELSPAFQPPEAWRRRGDAVRNLSSLEAAPVPAALGSVLRPYQRLGVAWLWHLWRHELGGILADEMGLGKTLQALGFLAAVQESGTARGTGGFLVVCPASLLENWRREAARFTPGLRVFVHHADRRLSTAEDFAPHDLILTSYGTLARDQELFSSVPFAVVIGDEAQHVKNRRSRNAAALRALRARGRFLLTGTPLENSLQDLRSLFDFLLPGYIARAPEGARAEERAWFDERLRAQAAPYLLRRSKKSVAPELPDRLENIVWCEMGATQAALYRSVQESSERELVDLAASGASEQKLRFAALTQLLRLRQICCDPRLVEARVAGQKADAFDHSAKLEAFRELLAEAVDDGHRVLVFSQFTSLLALLREDLDVQEISYAYLDGSMPAKTRQAEVDRFQTGTEAVFLLSLKAGGTGLNLTAADTVIHFDPWWNPAAEAQATDRAHRIGQTRTVTSYKLIVSGTVEERVLALQKSKQALLNDVLDASDAAASALSVEELRGLIS